MYLLSATQWAIYSETRFYYSVALTSGEIPGESIKLSPLSPLNVLQQYELPKGENAPMNRKRHWETTLCASLLEFSSHSVLNSLTDEQRAKEEAQHSPL